MRTSSKISTLAIATGLVVAGFAGPAQAQLTTATFTIGTGSIAISAPGTSNLGTVTAGAATASGSLGAVTVTDNRGVLAATWSAGVISTAFVGPTTILATGVTYASGTPTTTSVGVFVPSAAIPVVGAAVAGTWAGPGSNLVSWNPTVTVLLPVQQVAGAYSATITHSVA
jgi:hypothetical protein